MMYQIYKPPTKPPTICHSVSFKKPKGHKLFNILVETDDIIIASEHANDYMKKREIHGYNEYGISKYIIHWRYIGLIEGVKRFETVEKIRKIFDVSIFA